MSAGDQDAEIFSGNVTPEWINRGVYLSRAALEFGNPIFGVPAREAAERFAELRDGETTEMFEASSQLSGEARNKELLARLVGDEKEAYLHYYINRNSAARSVWFNLGWDGTLLAFGANGAPNKELEWIPMQAWYWLHPDPAKKDVVGGEGMTYYYVRVVDPRRHVDRAPSPAQPPVLPPHATKAASRKTGPRPDIKNGVAAAMRREIASGKITLEQLSDMPKKQLPARFAAGASETTCFEARKQVLQTLTSPD